MKKTLFVLLLMMATATAFSQIVAHAGKGPKRKAPATTTQETQRNVVYARIEGNDTILIVKLPEVDIDLMNRYYQITETYKGRKLVSNVRKVYPYARLASDKLQEYDTILAHASSDAERRQLMKQAEKEITDRYTEELEHLTFSQGAILIRLIDRETGNTSYKLVQELRGKVRAFFYQGFARLWGYNLKTEFDPKNDPEDEQIDVIATLLERGQI
ncbi:MAG: DUF4294 domain-containing protein [Bacteroidales bacterium]|nr:DUF4294 domain-containing protein [Bacteroidales bacterium]